MILDKAKIDSLLRDFSELKDKNQIDKKNLAKFKDTKEDQVFLSYLNDDKQAYMTFLHYLVMRLKPQNIVELGNREGVSTVAIYDAASKTGSEFYSADIELDQRYCPEHMFSDPKMHFLFGDVLNIDIIKKMPKNIDLLFSDTIHFDFQVRDEWEIYEHLLADQALVAIDDININDKRKLFDEVPYLKWDLTEVCHLSGWGLFLYERKGVRKSSEELAETTARLWERKYNTLFKEHDVLRQRATIQQLKNILKKITPMYKLYTYFFNTIYFKLNSKKKVFYASKIRV